MNPKQSPSIARRARRGFSLIEAVVVIVVLAISVPPTILWLDSSVSRQADAINATRATFMATTIIENILADSASTATGLGFEAFVNSALYLDTPVNGLRARLSTQFQGLTTMGFTYTVNIGGIVGPSGVVDADPLRNTYRIITVTIAAPSASGPPLSIAVSAVIAAR